MIKSLKKETDEIMSRLIWKHGKRLWNTKGYKLTIYTGSKWIEFYLNKQFNVLNIELFKVWFSIVLPDWCQTKEYYYQKGRAK